MARTRHRHKPAEIEANLTPMIDVSFLLIVFFALVSGIVNRDHSAMLLAQVREGAAARPSEDARWVLNVLPGTDGSCAGYALNGALFDADAEGVARLAEALADGYRANPRLAVNLRADRATEYRFVEPAMRAATTAARLAGGGALPRLNLVVEEERPGRAQVSTRGSSATTAVSATVSATMSATMTAAMAAAMAADRVEMTAEAADSDDEVAKGAHGRGA